MDQDDEMHLDERGPRDRPKWNEAKGDYAAKKMENGSKFCKVFIDTNKRLYSQNEVDAYRDKYEVIIKNGTDQQPLLFWEDCTFPRDLMSAIAKQQFKQPTPIQAQVFPLVMGGKDVIGIAQTGSGKTIGYLFPGILHILDQTKPKNGEGPIALILAPTRELCVQIEEQVKQFAYPCGMTSACVYGGNQNRRNQMYQLDRCPEIIVACPGRLLDFLNNEKTNLDRVTYLVIDEADRLLDMGFEPQVRDIVSRIRMERQTVFFSATWPKDVQQLARDFCQNDPVYLQIGKHNLTINKDIQQDVVCLYGNQKLQKLMEILDSMLAFDKVLIFAETKLSCEQLSRDLTREGYYCESLHGDKSQDQRDKVMASFKSSETRLVCATDLASRGLDVKDITVVINYDFPRQFDDYIHRIGRTGRAGQKGRSFSFLSYDRDDIRIAKQLIKIMHEANQPIRKELEDFANHYFPAKSMNGSYKPNNNQGYNHSFKPTQAQNDKEFYLNQKKSNYGGDQYQNNQRGYDDNGRRGDYNRGNDDRNYQGGQQRNNNVDRGNNYNNNRGFDNDRGSNRRGYDNDTGNRRFNNDNSNRGNNNRENDTDWRNNDRGSRGFQNNDGFRGRNDDGFRGRNDDRGQNDRFSDRQNDNFRGGGQNNRFNDRDNNSRGGQNDRLIGQNNRFDDKSNDSQRGAAQNTRFNDRENSSRGQNDRFSEGQNDNFRGGQNERFGGQNDRFEDRQNDNFRGGQNDRFGGQNNRFEDRQNDNFRGGQNDRFGGQNNRFEDRQNDGFQRQNDNFRGNQNNGFRGQNDRFSDRGNNQWGRGQNERFTERNNAGDRMNSRNNDRGNRDQQEGRGNNSRFNDRGDNQRFQNRNGQSDNNNDNGRNNGHPRNNNERYRENDNQQDEQQQDGVELKDLGGEEQFYKQQFQTLQADDQGVQNKSRDPSPPQQQ